MAESLGGGKVLDDDDASVKDSVLLGRGRFCGRSACEKRSQSRSVRAKAADLRVKGADIHAHSHRHICSVKGADIYPHTAILHVALVAALCSCTDVALVDDDKYLSSSYYYMSPHTTMLEPMWQVMLYIYRPSYAIQT